MPPKKKAPPPSSSSSTSSSSTKQQAQQPTQSKKNNNELTKTTATEGISWPSIPPSLLTTNRYLTLETLLENQIYTVRNFFPSSLCSTYVKFLASLPLSTTPGKPKRGEAVRVNDRFQVWDEEFARKLWEGTGLRKLLEQVNDVGEGEGEGEGEEEGGVAKVDRMNEIWGGDVVGLSPNMRIYRYTKGQFFDQHYDDYNTLLLPISPNQFPTKCHTTYTLLLYLTSPPDVLGGETVFYNDTHPTSKIKKAAEAISVTPERGMILLHKHGKDCLLHEGKVVISGEKWVLRTDLVVKG